MADSFLQQLIEEGDLDSHGRITLDPSKARQKLADSRFGHSSEALLAVVSAYLLAGAREVRIRQSREGWQFCSDAQPPSRAELSNLMQDMFSNDQPPALRELALAFNSLYPKQYGSLELIVGGEQRGWFENGHWRTQPIPGMSGFAMQLTLQRHSSLREWWKWLTRRWARLSDLQILQARTRWSPAPVRFQQGAQWPSSYELDPPALPVGTLATMHIECPIPGLGLPPYPGSQGIDCHHRLTRARTTLRCALLPGDPRHSQLLLVYRGLILARHLLPGNVVRFEGVLNTDSLDLDASRQHIVQNQRVRQRAETARQWVLEGTAAWLRQLDPNGLTPELLTFLTELLSRVNNSAGHKQILAALDELPLVALADEATCITLAELRASLAQFPALHFASSRELRVRFPGFVWEARLHGRPLLHPDRNNLKKLSQLLRMPLLDAMPWCRQNQQKPPVEGDRQDCECFELSGIDWRARVHLSRQYGYNLLAMLRSGEVFLIETDGLFETPTSLQIFLDGEYDGPLDVAQKRVLAELRVSILADLEKWLEALRASADTTLAGKLPVEHYASLLCLWMRGEPGVQRTPTAGMLAFGHSFLTPAGVQVDSLLSLISDPQRLIELSQDNPVRLLADWFSV